MSPRHLPAHLPARFSWKAVRVNAARASRRLASLKRACAIGGVSLALLAGAASADAQTALSARKAERGLSQAAAAPAAPAGNRSLAATFAAPVVNPYGLAPPLVSYFAPAAADLDGDGDVDLIGSGSTGDLYYFQNTAGAGNVPAFAAPLLNPFGLADAGTFGAPTTADFDGDGDIDILVGRAGGAAAGDISSGTFIYFANTGTATAPAFAAGVVGASGLGDVGSYSAPTAADFDGDGDIDVLSGRSVGDYRYYQNTAGRGAVPVFAAVVSNPFGLLDIGTGNNFSQPTAADIDRDGDLDLLVQSDVGNFFYYQNTAAIGAAPTFAAAVQNPFGLTDLGPAGVTPAIADFDGDGDLDVFASVGSGTSDQQYFLNGDTAALTATLTGTQGWRMLASPVPTQTLANLLGPISTQGVPGGDTAAGAPNVYAYTESAPGTLQNGYVVPATLATAAGAGNGYFVYVYTDDDTSTPGVQGSFPKTLTAAGASPASPFAFALSFTNTGAAADDGWNLLGNPFGRWFDWDAAAKTNLDASVYVYNPVTSTYLVWNGTAGSLLGGIVAPFQGFWAKASAAAPALRATAPVGASGGPFYGRSAEDVAAVVGLSMRRADGAPMRAEAFVTFGQPDAAAGVDALDAYALTAPDAEHLTLATEALGPDGTVALAIDARPVPGGSVTVPVQAAATTAGDMLLSWPTLADVPAEWTVELHDTVTGAIINLRTAAEYAFALAATPALTDATPAARRTEAAPARFTLVVGRGAVAGEAPAAAAFALSAPRPNPTTGGAAMDLDLATAATVSVGVYDALGRKVATLAEGAQPAGRLALRLPDGALAAGVYVVRAEIAGLAALTQRLVVTR